jgi:hypothetical protein
LASTDRTLSASQGIEQGSAKYASEPIEPLSYAILSNFRIHLYSAQSLCRESPSKALTIPDLVIIDA